MSIASDIACPHRMTRQAAHPDNFKAYGHFNWTDLRGYRELPGDGDIVIYMLPHTTGHDLFGYEDPVTIANHEYIAETVKSVEADGEETALVLVQYHNTDQWAIRDNVELEWWEVEIVGRLLDYPCLDGDRVNEIEVQWTAEYWDRDGSHDVARELEGVTWDDVEPVIHDVLAELEVWPSHLEGGQPIYLPEDWRAIVAGVKSRLTTA